MKPRAPGGAAMLAMTALTACAGAPASRAPVAAVAMPPVPAGMQYLYGSGEAAALDRQVYGALTDYVRAQMTGAAGSRTSVLFDDGATPAAPAYRPCRAQPPAIVLDVDETVLLNLGYERIEAQSGQPYDAARWSRWERGGARAVAAVPGAVAALSAIRAMGVTVVFNSNRSAANAADTAAAIAGAGLGPAVHGETLFLRGDAGDGSGKDARRARIAQRYCVIAMVGDQLGDFSDRFTGTPSKRRAAVQAPALADRWGRGWFLLPNPVYGAGLAGGYDDVFPTDRIWVDPMTVEAK